MQRNKHSSPRGFKTKNVKDRDQDISNWDLNEDKEETAKQDWKRITENDTELSQDDYDMLKQITFKNYLGSGFPWPLVHNYLTFPTVGNHSLFLMFTDLQIRANLKECWDHILDRHIKTTYKRYDDISKFTGDHTDIFEFILLSLLFPDYQSIQYDDKFRDYDSDEYSRFIVC